MEHETAVRKLGTPGKERQKAEQQYQKLREEYRNLSQPPPVARKKNQQ